MSEHEADSLPILTEEFLCVRCARHTETCCQWAEIYITPGDRERIAEAVGNRDFYEFRPPHDPVYLKHDDDPIWPRLVFKKPDGTRRVLKQTTSGCTFLGERGCVLPLETRPLICRIYPYHFNEQGILPTLAEGCPTELLRPEQSLIEALEMNLDDARRWQEQLYRELQTEVAPDADWSHV